MNELAQIKWLFFRTLSTPITAGFPRAKDSPEGYYQGALDLETFQLTFVEGEKINDQTTPQMLEKLERNNQAITSIHVLVDNAHYHHAKILQPWLDSPERWVNCISCQHMPHIAAQSRACGASCTIRSHTIGTMQRSTSSSRRFSISSSRHCQKMASVSTTQSLTTSAAYRSKNIK